ncbi:MAG: formyltetrahydrofolate deformylase [Opitutaceae bacterium]
MSLVALLHGPDQPGLVARVAGWIFERGGNIVHADQHRDQEEGVFFQRVEWAPARGASARDEASAFESFARTLGMKARVASSGDRVRVLLMVSKAGHCFHDLVLRFKAGEFSGDIVGVVSNHRDLEEVSRNYGLPFYHTAVQPETKDAAEQKQLAIIHDSKAQLVVLARYMQVLSDQFLERAGAPVINIHHSFLPAFAGGRPYHQAHARGVKLIGATAHYATAVLDDGPIIAQDVARVTHRHGAEDMIRKGRDLEKLVLAQAVRWHLENRILVYDNKTVVFD